MYLVFDIGGTYIKHALMSIDGNVIEKDKIHTSACGESIEGFVDVIAGAYKKYMASSNDIEGIAVAVPGLVDVDNGIVYEGGALPYLHRQNVAKLISNACDRKPVAIENDGKCAALAEVWLGNAKDVDNACVIVIGTGIGGGIVINRHVHRGNYLVAGELSFLLENMTRQELEEMQNVNDDDRWKYAKYFAAGSCSTRALRERVAHHKNIKRHDISGEEIFALAEEGDTVCIDAIEDLCFMIAKHCLDIYMIVNPDVILIGGGISAQPSVIQKIQQYADKFRNTSSVYDGFNVKLCKFGNDSNLIGALYNYIQKYVL